MAPALVLALLAAQLAGKTFAVDAQQSTVKFHVDHKLHKVDGQTRAMEAKAAVGEDGKLLAMVRIPVTSLDSGDANRDANMREVLEVGKHPFVVFKGVGTLPSPVPRGAPFEVTLQGQLELHGMTRTLELPLRLQLAEDGSVRARGTTHLSLDAYRIQRPSLLLVKLEDDCRIDFDLVLRAVSSQ